MSDNQITIREMFNKMADKKVNIGEWKDHYKKALNDTLTPVEKLRRHTLTVPASSLIAIFGGKSQRTKDLLKTQLYLKTGGVNIVKKENQAMSKELFLSIAEDFQSRLLDKKLSECEYSSKLAECTVRAWNASEDKSEEIRDLVYLPSKYLYP